MFKLTLLLGAAIFLVLLIGGEDRGQLRPGLAAAALQPAPAPVEVAATPAPSTPAVVRPADAADIAPATAPVVFAAPAPAPENAEAEVFSLATFADPAADPAAVPGDAAAAPAPDTAALVAEPPAGAGTAEVPGADTGSAGPIAIVDAESVNVRSGPGTEFVVLTRLSRGETVTQIADAGNGWALVRMEGDGIEGYIAARYLTQP